MDEVIVKEEGTDKIEYLKIPVAHLCCLADIGVLKAEIVDYAESRWAFPSVEKYKYIVQYLRCLHDCDKPEKQAQLKLVGATNIIEDYVFDICGFEDVDEEYISLKVLPWGVGVMSLETTVVASRETALANIKGRNRNKEEYTIFEIKHDYEVPDIFGNTFKTGVKNIENIMDMPIISVKDGYPRYSGNLRRDSLKNLLRKDIIKDLFYSFRVNNLELLLLYDNIEYKLGIKSTGKSVNGNMLCEIQFYQNENLSSEGISMSASLRNPKVLGTCEGKIMAYDSCVLEEGLDYIVLTDDFQVRELFRSLEASGNV
jgi:hypothetical protein